MTIRGDLSDRLQEQFALHILAGNFDTAQQDLLEIKSLSEDGSALANAASATTLLWHELGDQSRAAAAAQQFAIDLHSFDKGPDVDVEIDVIFNLYLADTIDEHEFERRRDAWIAADRLHLTDLYGASAYAWIPAYARGVRSPEDAREALATLQKYLPLPHPMLRDSYRDDAIGWTYHLAGDDALATQYLARGAHSCTATLFPFQHTAAIAHLAALRGAQNSACDEYRRIVSRWGSDPRSVTALSARKQLLLRHCN